MGSMYRFEVKWPISRGKGKSAIAKAAYNGRTKLFNERKDKWTRDYGKADSKSRGSDDVLFSGIFVDPKFQPPEWVQDRSRMWNEALRKEKKANALEAQEIILNLPNDLSFKGQKNMVIDFVRENITRGTGRVADVNIHDAPKTGDERNKHVHILFTLRAIGPEGFSDKRLPKLTPEQVTRWRTKWAERGERELRREGFDQEADRWKHGHRTNKVQQREAMDRGDHEWAKVMDREPAPHLGPHVVAMEAKGIRTDKGEGFRRVHERNELKAEAKERLKETGNSVENLVGKTRKAGKVIGKTVEIVADAFDSLFSPVMTPARKLQAELSRLDREIEAETTMQQLRDQEDRGRGRGRDR